MHKPTFDRIQDRIEAFVEEVSGIVSDALRERLATAARRSTGSPGTWPKTREGDDGQRAGRATGRRAGTGLSTTRQRADKRPRGAGPRDSALDPAQESLLEVIQLNPGQRMETLASLLQRPTRELSPSVKRLIAQRLVRTKGQKRATTYWAR